MREILLTQNQRALVDDDDFEWLSQYRWCAVWNPPTRSFYAVRNARRSDAKRGAIFMHQSILKLKPDERADHWNHDTLDNRRENLRRCTYSQNAANRRMMCNNTSGFKGAHWNKQRNKWRAMINWQGVRYHLGYFNNLEDAAHAFDAKARELFGEFAYCNFQEEAV